MEKPFQILSATIGVKFLTLLGIPVFRERRYIELPNMALEVAENCSGDNDLVS